MGDDKTKLDYNITPTEVYYTRDVNNPSVQILTIGASNTSDEDVTINGFRVKIPVSADPKSHDAITSDPSSIRPESLQPGKWDFQSVGDGLYGASPIPPVTIVKAHESITFQLKNIVVNEADGTVIIVITEDDGTDVYPKQNKQVVKIKSDLDIKTFTANPTDISSGDPSTLAWTTVAVARVLLSPGTFPGIKVNDSVTVHPDLTTTYTLTAFGEGPNISKQVTAQIPPPKIIDFKAEPANVNAGDMVRLSWEVQYASDVSIAPGDLNNLPLKGFKDVPVKSDTTFILTAINKGLQSTTRNAAVKINPVKVKSFTALPGYGVQVGDAVQLTWEIDSATSAFIQPGSINIPQEQLKKGSWWVNPTTATTYVLTANGQGSEAQQVNVLPMAKNWYQYTANAPFDSETLGVLNYKKQMWLLALSGRTYNSWNGQAWASSSQAQWQGRSGCTVCVFNDKMWLAGGKTQTAWLNDVWSSTDGATWTKETSAAQWSARRDLRCFVLPGTNKMFAAGGTDAAGNFLNDVWSTSDGINWTQETSNAFNNGGMAGFAVTVCGKIAYAIGGNAKSGFLNTTFYSADAQVWQPLTTPQWPARTNPKAVDLKSGLYFGFGTDTNTRYYDMYSLPGTGCFIAAVNQAMTNISPHLLEYQNAVWCIGGAFASILNQAVWSYNPVIPTDTPTQKTTGLQYDQGQNGGRITFMISCNNLPIGTKVSFYGETVGTDPSICLTNAIVETSPVFLVGLECSVPANYSSMIYGYATAPNGSTFPENSSIRIIAMRL